MRYVYLILKFYNLYLDFQVLGEDIKYQNNKFWKEVVLCREHGLGFAELWFIGNDWFWGKMYLFLSEMHSKM